MTTATTTQALQLNLPPLKWPLYWELSVTNGSIWIKLMKRPLGLRRNAIEAKAMAYVSHDGSLTQPLLDEISRIALEMATSSTPADGVFRQLFTLVDTNEVKVVLDR